MAYESKHFTKSLELEVLGLKLKSQQANLCDNVKG
jgi:hypothetical protein